MGFPARSYTNWVVQPQKMASGLKFQTWEVEGLHYLISENKSTDQLRCDRSADLLLYFRICKKQVFSCSGSWYVRIIRRIIVDKEVLRFYTMN